MVRQRRAALAVLCVFAVALSASLFPAGGFGTQPSGIGIGDGSDSVDGVLTEPVDAGPPATDATETDDATTSDGTTTTERTETTTETETATTTAGADSADDQSGAGPLPGLRTVLSAALVLLVALFAVGFRTGTVGVASRSGGSLPFTLTVRGIPVGRLVGSVPARTMSLVVGLSASVPRVLDDAAGLVGAAGANLATVGGALARGLGDALRIGLRGLGAALGAIPRALAGLAGSGTVLSMVSNVGVPGLGRGDRDGGRGRASDRSAVDDADDPADPAPPTVEEAWHAMTDRLRLSNPETRTPGEFARAALDRGYPDEAVGRLTDAFREVRYGDLPRSDRTEAARAALDRLRDHWGGGK